MQASQVAFFVAQPGCSARSISKPMIMQFKMMAEERAFSQKKQNDLKQKALPKFKSEVATMSKAGCSTKLPRQNGILYIYIRIYTPSFNLQ